MQITKFNGNSPYVQQIDAQSRLAVWAANNVNSALISKLGLTHIQDGTVDSSGMRMLHTTGPGLTLEKISITGPKTCPYGGHLVPTHPMESLPFWRDFVEVAPDPVLQTLNEMIGGYDPVYVAEGLELSNWDMDKVSGPKLCRDFCPPRSYEEIWDMFCYDVNGNFKGSYRLSFGSVFEVKHFKYCDSPAIGSFLFAPRNSVIYTPPRCNGTFTTNANILFDNSDIGWLCTAGGVENLDWEIIRRYEKNARLVWPVFPDDSLLTMNNFAEAFAIISEARRHGIKMNILRAEATVQFMGDMWEAQECLLEGREIKKVARRYHLPINPVWNDLPGEIDFDEELPVREVPPFWKGNRIAVFFGKTSGEFMKELVIPRITPWIDCDRVLIIVDEKDRGLARQVYAAGGGKVAVASFEVFKDEHVFLEKVPSLADMIFIVPPHSDDGKEKVIDSSILDVCAQAGLPVGIFSRSEDAPLQETASDTVLYCVTKSKAAEDVFSVKNMSSMAIVKYKFSSSGVEETPGTEDEMSKGE